MFPICSHNLFSANMNQQLYILQLITRQANALMLSFDVSPQDSVSELQLACEVGNEYIKGDIGIQLGNS